MIVGDKNLDLRLIYATKSITIKREIHFKYIRNLKYLQEIIVQNIPEDLILLQITTLSSITSLNLGKNRLKYIPTKISNLKLLKLLNLSNNQLTFIPDSISNLSSLQELNLSNNQLTSIPDTIGNLLSLQILDLYNNQLTYIPDTIGKLSSLKYYIYIIIDLHI